jgi:hypothetical protein
MWLTDDRVVKLQTPYVPKPSVDREKLAAVEDYYLATYFRSAAPDTSEPVESTLPTLPMSRRGGSMQERGVTLWIRKPQHGSD